MQLLYTFIIFLVAICIPELIHNITKKRKMIWVAGQAAQLVRMLPPMQGCSFNTRAGHITEPTNEGINKWSTNQCFSFSLSPFPTLKSIKKEKEKLSEYLNFTKTFQKYESVEVISKPHKINIYFSLICL